MNLIGKRLGQYQIRSEIGRGEKTVVYRAHQPVLDRDVALKVLLDQSVAQGWQRAARAAARLSHPRIVAIYDVGCAVPAPQTGAGEGQAYHYIAMKYVAGQSLKQMLRRQGPLPPAQASQIVSQAAEALDYAHSQGVIHGAVKPSNLLIDRTGHVVVTDFSAEPAGGAAARPETDVCALGVVCYEMLAGWSPFLDDPDLMLRARLAGALPAARLLPAGIPEQVDRVVKRALHPDPRQRYRRAGTFAADLQAAVGRTAAGQARRRWLMRGIAALGAILLLILAGLLLAGGQDQAGEPAATFTATSPARTPGPMPTPTPTATRTPTITPRATATLQPTSTRRPTSTATTRPTASRTSPPSPTPGRTATALPLPSGSPPPTQPGPAGTAPPAPATEEPAAPVTERPPPTAPPRAPTPTSEQRPPTPNPGR